MRPPSYYTSLSTYNYATSGSSYNPSAHSTSSSNLSRSSGGSATSSSSLRSSFSSPSSSSYVTRTHLPFASQSVLVAHCFTGAGSTTKPYGGSSQQSSSFGRSQLLNSSNSPSTYSTSYSRPRSTRRTNYQLQPTSSSIRSYSPASTTSARSSYTKPNTYSRPSAAAHRPLGSTSYYQPIRLRDRPLLTQISRQLNSTGGGSSRPSEQVPSSSAQKPPTGLRVEQSSSAGEPLASSAHSTEPAAANSDADWSSDVARNISRNKYLIKFREFDKRPSVAPQESVPVVAEDPASREEVRGDMRQLPASEKDLSLTQESEEKEPKIRGSEQQPEAVDSKPAPEQRAATQKPEETPAKKKRQEQPAAAGGTKLRLRVKASSRQQDKQSDEQRKSDEAKVAAGAQSPTVKVTSKPKRLAVKTSAKKSNSENKEDSGNKKENNQSESPPISKTAATRRKPSTPKTEDQAEGERKPLAERRQQQADVKLKVENDRQTEPERQAEVSVEPSERKKQEQANKRIKFRDYHLDDFNFLSVLGHGGWGFVILAELKEHDACFAVKCIKKITIVEDDDFDSIMIERKMLTLGNVHPFICKLFCTFETEGYLFFVMEYCAGGDLMFHVQKEGKFSESRCRFYAAEIICAIRFLHNRHIIYRDLKLDNILLDSKGHVRLVDFGMCQCRTYREEMLPSNFCGTPEYISPEIIKGVPYNHSVDWWSFGVLLYEMAVGKMPFRGNDENELLWNVCYEQIHYPMFLTKELSSLLQSLLEREPSKRMGMASCKLGDIYDQSWFRGVDWASVEEMRVAPPFVPEVRSTRDVQNFDSDFTESRAELSPVDERTLERIDQNQFQKFPYTNPNIFIFDSQ